MLRVFLEQGRHKMLTDCARASEWFGRACRSTGVLRSGLLLRG